MAKSFAINNLQMKLCIVFLCVGLGISCQTDEASLQNDALASQTINKSSKVLSSGQKLSQDDFQKLKAVYEKHPTSKTTRDTYRSALIKKEDWATLEKFFKQIPASELSDQDKSNLGKAYIKLGRYKDAIQSLKPLAKKDNFEVKTLLANAYFHLGDYAESKNLLDENWEQIVKEKKVFEITLRGMIYFYQGDSEKAIEILNKSIEIQPDNISAANGLSRVYAAKGDTEKAEEYLAKVQKGFDRMTAEETRKTTLVRKLIQLQEAYKAKRFQEVINLVKEVLPEAKAGNKPALMQYLFNSYKALGKTKEAQEILEQAKKMQQKNED